MLLTILTLSLFTLVFAGMEIAWAIGVSCLVYLLLAQLSGEPVSPVVIPSQMLDGVDSFSVLAVPLFIFAGELMSLTGLTRRLIDFATAFVGHIRGGLANVGVITNFILAGVSGSATADAAATGTVLLPEMQKKGYPVRFSCAVIAASSTVGPILPPSIMFLVLAAQMNLSVGRLFMAGIVPAVMISGVTFLLTYWIARRRGYPIEPRVDWLGRGRALARAALPLAAPLIVVRAIVSGVATPTEAAALLVFYVIMLGLFVFRTVSFRDIVHCAAKSAMTSSIIMLTLATAQIFSWLSVYEQFGETMTAAMRVLSSDVHVLLLLANLILLLLGMFLEPLPLVLIMAPVLFPMLVNLGVDPLHLAVVVVFNAVLGLITPPVGLVLAVLGVIAKLDPMQIFWEVLPYKIVLILLLLMFTYVPIISLWLPALLMK